MFTVLLAASLLAVAGWDGCSTEPERPSTDAPYRFDEPDVVHHLPAILEEISGLTVLDDRHLGAVQDEDGKLFVVDERTGAVVREVRFADGGDYEGVERVAESVYVLESNGDLYRLNGWQEAHAQVERIETPLRRRNDTEGLAFDAATNRLLIACKEEPGRGLDDARAVYAFDIAAEVLVEEPVLVVPLEDFGAARTTFKPAALAIHPLTGERYLVSSTDARLAVLAPNGAVRAVWQLPQRLLPQPEGLAFRPNGDLLIASEGEAGAGVLVRYRYESPSTGEAR